MHFFSAALLAICSISVTHAAPFPNPENEDLARRATYSVVNADEESSSSVAREVETVFETSTVTALGTNSVSITVTVTATPSSVVQSSTPAASSTPYWVTPDVFPTAGSSSLFHRSLTATGQPALFAREHFSSSSASVYASEYPTDCAAQSLDARGWYSVASGTQSVATVTASPTSLVARGFGDLYSSAATPSASATPLVAHVARSFGGLYSSAAPFYSEVNVPLSLTPLVARDMNASPSGTPSSSSARTSAAPLAVRGLSGWYSPVPSASSVGAPSASPALVARNVHGWGSSSVSSPVPSTFAASAAPVAY
ncbi:hypothetical protein Pdw03_1892 [Penicillium digitatum]|uniref:Uncharacterized protein n=3 Tax=Penicillium digitatum TaxID=36651 RepID=K9F9S6_PEND2|nr:hypothetical protein PDIP_29050 [Penicillium digitatum Pd1]EKV05869.1 hypothetical protein PDIG_80660 [Penicillium digitatum PHI26]EKV17927.1 hypothetical protein PDIP_29050 [Penicillium digitatum Pd1]QQK46994.1 hypothetical protein Pdw03_1892 [Penicillium digitatum]